jgi:two-component system phosphate regulon sensor histidine kinase PhoR
LRPLKPTFNKKLTASYLFVVAVTLLITGLFLTRRLKANYIASLEESLGSQAMLMRDLAAPLTASAAPGGFQTLAHRLGGEMRCRVTVVRADGVVLGDSERTADELVRMDNHRTRPEISAALASGTGEAMRYSRTLQEDMLYIAVPIEVARGRWGVLRVALPLTEVHKRVNAFQNDLIKAGAAAMGIAFLVALVSVRKISQPLQALSRTAREIGEGRYPREVAVATPDEFGELARAFSDMAGRIEEKVGELSRERAQLSAILAALAEGVVAVDHEGRVLFLNPAAEKLFGVQARELIGRPALEVLRHSAFQDVLRETLSVRRAVSQEISIHTPHDRSVLVQALPVSYSETQTGVLAALQDITELRRLERVRQEFVANVSHELRTPLTAIKGYVETLMDGAMDDKTHAQEFLKVIDDHTRHLALLIDDVLDLSAIEAKRVEYRFEPVALSEITERLLKGLAPMAKAKNLRMQNRLTAALPKVRADKDKLAQILMNLIDNAIKFNKDGGQVEITAEVKDGSVDVSIRDTGMGIQPADLPRVFERFYRADKSHSHQIAGTGLGLAIVKHLVEAHQGVVTAESIPTQGSTFRFTLPTA